MNLGGHFWKRADRAALGRPGRFLYFQPQKTKLCPDCEVLVLDAQTFKAQMAQWNGLIDPWQESPNYVPWTPTATPTPGPGFVRTMFTNYGGGSSGGGSGPPGGGGGSGGDSISGGGGGGVSNPSPNPGCPSVDQTAGKAYAQVNKADPSVFYAPNPQSSSDPYGQEAYGWIYVSNSNSNQYMYTAPIIEDLPSSGVLAIGNPPTYSGYTYEGWYHTHPFDPNSPQMIDQTTNNHFSPEDEAYSNQPAYVGVDDTLSGDNNSGESAMERWYRYDPSTKSETLMNSVGAGGC